VIFWGGRRTYQRSHEQRPRGPGDLWVRAVQNHAGDGVDKQQSPAQRVQERQREFKLEGQVRDRRNPLDPRLNQCVRDRIHAGNQERRRHTKEGSWLKIDISMTRTQGMGALIIKPTYCVTSVDDDKCGRQVPYQGFILELRSTSSYRGLLFL
jgi:hypothetical protein